MKYSFTYLLLLGLGLYVPLKLVVSDLRNPIKNQRKSRSPAFLLEGVGAYVGERCLFFVLVVYAALDICALWNELIRLLTDTLLSLQLSWQ